RGVGVGADVGEVERRTGHRKHGRLLDAVVGPAQVQGFVGVALIPVDLLQLEGVGGGEGEALAGVEAAEAVVADAEAGAFETEERRGGGGRVGLGLVGDDDTVAGVGEGHGDGGAVGRKAGGEAGGGVGRVPRRGGPALHGEGRAGLGGDDGDEAHGVHDDVAVGVVVVDVETVAGAGGEGEGAERVPRAAGLLVDGDRVDAAGVDDLDGDVGRAVGVRRPIELDGVAAGGGEVGREEGGAGAVAGAAVGVVVVADVARHAAAGGPVGGVGEERGGDAVVDGDDAGGAGRWLRGVVHGEREQERAQGVAEQDVAGAGDVGAVAGDVVGGAVGDPAGGVGGLG